MKKELKYKDAKSFRQSLEQRLLKMSISQNIDLLRLRRLVAFDRFLCRIFKEKSSPFVLKGGYALELIFRGSRSTKDIDLSMYKPQGRSFKKNVIDTVLKKAAALNMADFFSFRVGMAKKEIKHAAYGGLRFPIEARVDARNFCSFQLDIGVGDYWTEEHKTVPGHGILKFAGIADKMFPVISVEQQFAEKLHSYTYPRDITNTRTKDLVDMICIIKKSRMNIKSTRFLVKKTFQAIKSHELPPILPVPPESWQNIFSELSNESGLEITIADGYKVLKRYYEKIR